MRNRPPQQFLSRQEAARQLNCSLRTISRYQRAGRLRFERRGGRTCILREDVFALKREPPASQGRIDQQRMRIMMVRLVMLESKMADCIAELDRRFEAQKPTSEDFSS